MYAQKNETNNHKKRGMGNVSEQKIQKSMLSSPPALHMHPGVLGCR